MTNLRAGKESRRSSAPLSLAEIKEIRSRTVKGNDRNRALRAVQRGNTAPLSFAQERLWFLDQLGLVGSAYNIHMALRARGELDPRVLEQCLKTIVQRHESLRTRFERRQGVPVQVIEAEDTVRLSVEDLSHLQEQDQLERVNFRSISQAQRRMDISKGEVLAASLLRLAEHQHILLLTLHHIVADGWSLAILNHELSVLYSAYVTCTPNPLLPLPIQYADYAIWQRETSHERELESQLSYWKAQLDGMVEDLALPTDHVRPEVPSFRGEMVDIKIPAAVRADLEQVARQESATLYMVLLASFSVLLSRYSRQQEVSVGCTVAGRTQPKLESLVGMFANTLVLRIDLSGRPSFRDLLRRVREVTLGAYAHQEVPLERLVNELKPQRALAKQPLFQVTLSLQDQPKEPLRMEGVTWENEDHLQVSSQFDLSFRLVDTGDTLTGGIEYATDLFERQTIERMSEHWRTLLGSLLENPDAPVGVVSMMGPAEWSIVTGQFNQTAATFPEEAQIHCIFEDRAVQIPDAIAVSWDGGVLTFSGLNAAASRLAFMLLDLGVTSEDRVGILVDRSTECLIGILASLKAGAAYVPLDPTAPEERLAMMIADSSPRVLLLTQNSRLEDSSSRFGVRPVAVDAKELVIPSDEPRELPEVIATPRRNAYVIYTSGSTGVPKGVAVENGQLASLWRALEPLYETESARQRIGINAPLFFDSSVKQWIQLLSGRTVVLIPQGVRADPHSMLKYVEQKFIDGIDCTPSQLSGWVAAGLLRRSSIYPHVILVGGESIDGELWSKLAESEYRTFYNVYGPTECTVDSCYIRISQSVPRPTIGTPMQNSQIYILDENGMPVPMGIKGEIHIAGSRVARGYLGRPDLTAQRFIADPFSSERCARMYRSGDFGRWRPDGTIEFFGRSDDQVKVRGHRIELGEVEANLRSCLELQDAAVSVAVDSTGSRRLVGHVVPKCTDTEAVLEAAIEHLAAHVPEYMIPTQWTIHDRLPITPNGKLNRRALADSVEVMSRAPLVAPQTELEIILAETWREVLHVDGIGVDDNFFELGGHSLMGAQLLARVSERCQVMVPPILVFQAPTVRRMAQAIQNLKAAVDDGRWSPILERAEVRRGLEKAVNCSHAPLSFSQTWHWRMFELARQPSFRGSARAFRLLGAVDVVALRSSLAEVVKRHAALRTLIVGTDSSPHQQISDEIEDRLRFYDLGGFADPLNGVQRIIDEVILEPVNFTREPLFTIVLMRLGPREHVLLIAVDHMISDAVSASIVVGDLLAIYRNIVRGSKENLPPVAVQFPEFATWQQRNQQDWVEKDGSYWDERLRCGDSARFPASLDAPVDKEGLGIIAFDVPKDVGVELSRFSRSNQTTPAQCAFTAHAALTSLWCERAETVVQSQTTGRGVPGVEGTVGYFAALLGIRVNISAHDTFEDLLKQVGEEYYRALDRTDYSYLAKQIDRNKFCRNSVFNWIPRRSLYRFPRQNDSEMEITVEPFEFTNPLHDELKNNISMDCDPEIILSEEADGIHGQVCFPRRRFSSPDMTRFAQQFVRVLRTLIYEPRGRVRDLDVR